MANKIYNQMDNEQRRRLEEKRRKRMEKEAKREARMEKNAPKYERNTIAFVGFILACNCIWISFTGWYVWLDLVALVMCLIGLSSNRPKNLKKYLALIGAGLACIAMFNAVRVSNKFLVDQDNINQLITYESVMDIDVEAE